MAHSTSNFYLNIIWHQHQPLYLDSEADRLQAPWVRTHGTKDYYDMAAMLEPFPDVHCTFNLTSSLLLQLEQYYVKRLKPFVDVVANRIDVEKFFREWRGKTDPWIDLALTPTSMFDEADLNHLLHNPWNALYITDVMLARFPAYKALKDKFRRGKSLSEQDLREVKFWFFLAYFDPEFLEKKVSFPDGTSVDLSDIVQKKPDGTYSLNKVITEDDCNRIVAETYKILANIIPIHKKLFQKKQIDIVTTPFYHPILPLIYDSSVAKVCQPNDPMPKRFNFPRDAHVQIAKAVKYFEETFGRAPQGMWPAEGSVAHEVAPVFFDNGIHWIATDEKILYQSRPQNQPKFYPYRVGNEKPVAIVFRDTELSDKIGFVYQHWKGEDAANDFIHHILKRAPQAQEPDRLVSVILDGENAWEWYRHDNDGKEFLQSLYKSLTKLYHERKLITVTMDEYIHGNSERGVPAHPISSMREIEWLYPGSWISGNFDTWIGNDEKNKAWEYLLVARNDLENSGVKQPEPRINTPDVGSKEWFAYKAWDEMYAAEGSDWFWWYGTRMRVPGGTKPFDIAFRRHLSNVYHFAKLAGGRMPERTFEPIVAEIKKDMKTQGTMIQSSGSDS